MLPEAPTCAEHAGEGGGDDPGDGDPATDAELLRTLLQGLAGVGGAGEGAGLELPPGLGKGPAGPLAGLMLELEEAARLAAAAGPPSEAQQAAMGRGVGDGGSQSVGGAGGGRQGPETSTVSSSVPGEPTVGRAPQAPQSETLRQLMQRTRKTVAEQSRFTRGEGSVAPLASCVGETGQGGSGRAAAGLFGGGGVGSGFGGLSKLLEAAIAGGGLGAGADAAAGGGVGGASGLVVDFILRNLLSKDVLYGPLKVVAQG
jgi:hypothetical protein